VVSQAGVTSSSCLEGGPARLVLPDAEQRCWLLQVADPTGDDNGPAPMLTQPTGVFEKGVFDLKQFSAGVDGTKPGLQVRAERSDQQRVG